MNHPTAVIAEDEPLLREELKDGLAQLWPELVIAAEAGNGTEAVRALAEWKPDVLFVDIQMPGLSGLEVARVASGKCHVVFVTAYDKYAVSAFEQGAIEYVMKPFSTARLAMAVARVRDRMRFEPVNIAGLINLLRDQPRLNRQHLRWISVSDGTTVRLITTDEIHYIHADNKYTCVVTAGAQSLITKTIRELANELDPDAFQQIHRGTIVNLNFLDAIRRDRHGRMHVKLRQREGWLPVSASFAHLLRDL